MNHFMWIFNRNLADYDKDGRLTPDEFVVAMHCCDIARVGQTLPPTLPDEWLHANIMQRERTESLTKVNDNPTFAKLNQQLQETFNLKKTTEDKTADNSAEAAETERKNNMVTYEEKRLKNYEVCFEVFFLFHHLYKNKYLY